MGAEKSAKDADFTAFVVSAIPELTRIAWYLTGDAEHAKELVQASLVKTYMAWSRVRDGEVVAYTRRVVVLRYYCDLSEKNVARELGMSAGAVNNAAARGLAGLRQHTEAIKEWST